jgi:hypothetical protein
LEETENWKTSWLDGVEKELTENPYQLATSSIKIVLSIIELEFKHQLKL